MKTPFCHPVRVYFWLVALLATGCVTNRQLLHEIRGYKVAQDSLISKNNLIYRYEKSRIDSIYKNIGDADLLRRIEQLTRPKPKN